MQRTCKVIRASSVDVASHSLTLSRWSPTLQYSHGMGEPTRWSPTVRWNQASPGGVWSHPGTGPADRRRSTWRPSASSRSLVRSLPTIGYDRVGAFATTVNSSTSRAVPCRAVPCLRPHPVLEELRSCCFSARSSSQVSPPPPPPRYLVSRSVGLVGVGVKPSLFSLSLASSRVASKLSKGRLGGTGLVGRTAQHSTAQRRAAQHSTAQRRAAQHTGRLRQDVAGRTDGSTGSAQDSPRRLTGTVAWWPGGLVVVTHHGESTF